MVEQTFQVLSFNELSLNHKIQITKLKGMCFTYTNNPKVTEWDQYDKDATHLLLFDGRKLVAYARVCAPDTWLLEASFSRVCVWPMLQKVGLGKIIITQAMDIIYVLYGQTIQITVRPALIDYYKRFGFFLQPAGKISKDYYLMVYQNLKQI